MKNAETPTQLDLGRDEFGQLVADLEDGTVYYLTDCCRATAKGSMGAVVCRACYEVIDGVLGSGWRIAEYAATHTCKDCSKPLNACPDSPLHGR